MERIEDKKDEQKGNKSNSAIIRFYFSLSDTDREKIKMHCINDRIDPSSLGMLFIFRFIYEFFSLPICQFGDVVDELMKLIYGR